MVNTPDPHAEDYSSDGYPCPAFPSLSVPAEDLPALERLRSSEVGGWALSRAQQYEEYARALRFVNNSTVPIHRLLPPEVLIRIFGYLRPSESMVHAIRLMHVCRHWRTILIEAPEFWADMLNDPSAYEDGRYLKTLLCRSGSLPLNVRAVHPQVRDIISTPVMTPHLHRISYLELNISADKYVALYPFIKEGRFRALETLVLYNTGVGKVPLPMRDDHCTDAALPNLQQLKIAATLFSPYITVGSLTRLSIVSSTSSLELFSTKELYGGLARCARGLKSLTLNTAILNPQQYTQLEKPRHVRFRALEELSFVDSGFAALKNFLANVRVPPDTRISCRLPRIDETFREVLIIAGDQNLAAICAADRLRLDSSARGLSLRSYVGSQKLLDVTSPTQWFASSDGRTAGVTSAFSRAETVRALELHYQYILPDEVELQAVLNSFPRLTRLRVGVIGCGVHARGHHVLRALAGTPTQRLVCPALKELTVVADYSKATYAQFNDLADTIASALEERRARLQYRFRLPSFVMVLVRSSGRVLMHEVDGVETVRVALKARLEGLVEHLQVFQLVPASIATT